VPSWRRAGPVRVVLAKAIWTNRLTHLGRGKELAQHAQLTIDTNVAVYFC